MDLMEVRRNMMGVIAQMASGARVVSGICVVPSSGSTTVEFGKTFNNYLYFFEMTDESKDLLLNSGQTGVRTFAVTGKHSMPKADEASFSDELLTYRINPSTLAQSTNSTGAIISNIDDHSISFVTSNFSGGTNYFYRNCSYKYWIVEIE